MMTNRKSWLLSWAGVVLAGLQCCSCSRQDGNVRSADAEIRRDGFFAESDIGKRDDGLAYAVDAAEPFTGAVVTRDKEWRPRYFAYYYEGKLHGPETRWSDDGKTKRIFDYHFGELTRRREFYGNGKLKLDAMMKGEDAFGRHVRYDEQGKERFIGNFGEGLAWHGHIYDIDENGKVLWDAEFDHGRFLRGIYPESEKQSLIDAGMLKENGTPNAGVDDRSIKLGVAAEPETESGQEKKAP